MVKQGRIEAEAAQLGAGFLGGDSKFTIGLIWFLVVLTAYFWATYTYNLIAFGGKGVRESNAERYGLDKQELPKNKEAYAWSHGFSAALWGSLAITGGLRAYYLQKHMARKSYDATLWGLLVASLSLLAAAVIRLGLYLNCEDQEACDNTRIIPIYFLQMSVILLGIAVLFVPAYMAHENRSRAQDAARWASFIYGLSLIHI